MPESCVGHPKSAGKWFLPPSSCNLRCSVRVLTASFRPTPNLIGAINLTYLAKRGSGSIVNIASVLALLPEYSNRIYAATKSYVLTLSQSLAAEVTSKGIYVQAVLPAATRTEIYERAGGDISNVPDVMEVEDLVDAALVGFDRKELVTIPAVPDVAAWETFEQARGNLASGFSNAKPAARYKI